MIFKTALQHAMINRDALAAEFCEILGLSKIFGDLVNCGPEIPVPAICCDFSSGSLTPGGALPGLGVVFTRASTATSLDANGDLVYYEVDEPRFQDGGYLNEAAAANYFLNSDAPATQVVTRNFNHTYWIVGSGSMTLSGGLSGVVTEGNPISGNSGGAPVTCTIGGSVDRAQIEAGPIKTSYIPTAGVSAARAADNLYFTGVDVHQDFTIVYDVTPLYTTTAVDWRSYSTGGTDELRDHDGSGAEWKADKGAAGMYFYVKSNEVVEDGRRIKIINSAENSGADVSSSIYYDGTNPYNTLIPSFSLNHTQDNTLHVARYNTSSGHLIVHSISMFDNKLSDEQGLWLSTVGNDKECV